MDEMRQHTLDLLLEFQQEEVDGAALYKRIASSVKDEENRRIIMAMAEDEARHAHIMALRTKRTLKPRLSKIAFYELVKKLLGYTCVIKLMERGEEEITRKYRKAAETSGIDIEAKVLREVIEDEERHEAILLEMLKEERVSYIGSTVLGMNDALVELTGALAGYTFAMQNTRIISMAGLITGFSATLSMAASGFLSARADGEKNALKSCIYTGIAYFITVLLLITPYLLFHEEKYMNALFCTMGIAVGIIAFFNWYISIVLDRSFKKGFLEMAGLSIGVAVLSFILGIVVKNVLGIEL